MTPARIIVADPPWQMRDSLPGPKRGASKHYRTMSLEEIERFPLPPLADDCHLALWRLASMQTEALLVAAAWGFTVKSEIVWRKTTTTGKRWFGMGRQVRMEHEVCLIATRGRAFPRVRNIRSVFDAPAGRHSAKPDAFYELVERFSPGPYIELFARRQRPGWTCYGDELLQAQPARRSRG